MEEIAETGAEKYAIYNVETGMLVASGASYSPEMLVAPGQGIIKGALIEALDAFCVVEGVVVSKGVKPSPHHIFDYENKQWVDPRTLQDFKSAKWEEIKLAKDAAEFGGFDWNGSRFDSDAISQSRIQLYVQLAAMSPAFFIDWTLADNSVRTLDAAGMAAVGAALGAHVSAQHMLARGLRMQIDAATSSTQLENINWSIV